MIDHDEERERRIQDEAIVDAYGSKEQVLGWYYYLEDRIISHLRYGAFIHTRPHSSN